MFPPADVFANLGADAPAHLRQGSARHLKKLSKPTQPEPTRQLKARERHNMSARPWREPPPPRPSNASVMHAVVDYDIANPKARHETWPGPTL